MSKQAIGLGIVVFLAGIAVGSFVTWAVVHPPQPAGPYNMTPQQQQQAQRSVDRLRAATMLRSVAQAMISKHRQDPGWTFPDSEFALIRLLIEENFLSDEFLNNWPGGENRSGDQPPFFIIGTIGDVEALDPDAVLLYEHPDHHPELGGAIVYANANAVELEADAFRQRIDELRVQN